MQTEIIFTTRYAETDQMGVIHHSNYAIWFEAGRTDFLKKAGLSYSGIEAQGIMFPLYELNCRFKAPAKYEDEIRVVTKIVKCSRVRACFSYAVFNAADNRLLAVGETMHAWTDKELRPVDAQKAMPQVYALLAELAAQE